MTQTSSQVHPSSQTIQYSAAKSLTINLLFKLILKNIEKKNQIKRLMAYGFNTLNIFRKRAEALTISILLATRFSQICTQNRSRRWRTRHLGRAIASLSSSLFLCKENICWEGCWAHHPRIRQPHWRIATAARLVNPISSQCKASSNGRSVWGFRAWEGPNVRLNTMTSKTFVRRDPTNTCIR